MTVSKSLPTGRRPDFLYLYGERGSIARAHQLGELRLQPITTDTTYSGYAQAGQILPFGKGRPLASTDFLTLTLSSAWNETFFDQSRNIASCLVIRDTEKFGEQLHRAVQKVLPQWAGIDAAVAYGKHSPLGAAFTKGVHLASQEEWLFAWRPIQTPSTLASMVVQIGCMDSFAEVRALRPVSQ